MMTFTIRYEYLGTRNNNDTFIDAMIVDWMAFQFLTNLGAARGQNCRVKPHLRLFV